MKVAVVTEQGKEAVVAIFGTNEFFGEGCLAGQGAAHSDGRDDDGIRHRPEPAFSGSDAGLTATPYSSGGTEREQGIGKAGNARLRTVMVELAWLWQRYRPASAQVSWFRERISGTSRRMRK